MIPRVYRFQRRSRRDLPFDQLRTGWKVDQLLEISLSPYATIQETAQRERERVAVPRMLLFEHWRKYSHRRGWRTHSGFPLSTHDARARCRSDNGPISLRSETSFHRDCRRAAAPIMRPTRGSGCSQDFLCRGGGGRCLKKLQTRRRDRWNCFIAGILLDFWFFVRRGEVGGRKVGGNFFSFFFFCIICGYCRGFAWHWFARL